MTDLPPAGYASERVLPEPLPADANDAYRARLLDQHKHFVEMTMRYWGHIETANHFFLSLHTVILSGFTYLFTTSARLPAPVLALLVVVSCAMAAQWLLVLRSLHLLNKARHQIIQEWEESFPARPYQAEYYKLYSDKNPERVMYFRIQRVYTLLPLLVFAVYITFGILIALDVRLGQ